MLLLPIMSTIMLTVTFCIFIALVIYIKQTKANGINLCYFMMLAQIIGIITIWLLYINI